MNECFLGRLHMPVVKNQVRRSTITDYFVILKQNQVFALQHFVIIFVKLCLTKPECSAIKGKMFCVTSEMLICF